MTTTPRSEQPPFLNPQHAQHLGEFRIAPELLEHAGVRSVTDHESRELFGIHGYAGEDLAGILFPYVIDGHRVGGRVRLERSCADGAKYLGEQGNRHSFFLTPGDKDLLQDSNVEAVIVEAEKSKLALQCLADRTGRSILAVSVGGCWAWRRKNGKRIQSNGSEESESGPSPDFDLIKWEGRKVTIVFDANAETNLKVQAARDALAAELRKRGASVLISSVPPTIPGVNGPDDLLAVCGDDVMLRVLDAAAEPGTAAAVSTHWPEPESFGEELLPVPPFDLELLPISFRGLVDDISERMQTPPDYAAAAVIVALAGCVGRRALIRPKVEDTWEVIPNLWGAIVAPPGMMKSPVLRAITLPLYHVEENWRAEYEAKCSDFQLQKEQEELRWQAYREQYKSSVKKGETLPVPPDRSLKSPGQKRLILTDSTVEKLHEIISQNPAGVLVLRDELTGWLAELDRQGRESERAFFLQAWNGDAGFTIDRIGRGSIYVPAVCVSLLGNIQPSRLRWYLAQTIKGGPSDDGLFQRFQVLVWPDQPQSWRLVDRPPNATALAQAELVYNNLANLKPDEPVWLRFCSEAQALFFAWLTDLEKKVRGPGFAPSFVSHLAKYRSFMPSLAGLFALADLAADAGTLTENLSISLSHAQQAAALCEYLEAHARRAYACIASPESWAARELARHIEGGDLAETFKVRDVYRHGWSGLDDPEQVRAALDQLEDAGWVRRIESPGPAGKGRPSDGWQVNPKVVQHAE